MYKLIEFIRSIYVVLLFVVIEAVALHYYAHSSCYTQARLLVRSNQLTGGVQGVISGVKHYFSLGRENRALIARIEELQMQVEHYRSAEIAERLDSYLAGNTKKPYTIRTARVVSNSINKSCNFLVLNRGLRDSVMPDMAVLSPDGAMLGYVVESTQGYSVAIPVLNTSFRASGRLAGSDFFGSISWDGVDAYHVTMEELSKYAEPKPGDEVVSTGFSQYFPAEILIGTVEQATLNESRTAYSVRIRLAADFTGLGDVILVRNTDQAEVRSLEQSETVETLNEKK